MIRGYLEIHYEPECTDSVLTCIGLGYGKFLSDLAFTADSKYKQDDDYPETLFHERMSDLLEDLAEDYLEMPLLFSVELPAHMANLLGCLFRYTFLVMDREHFRQMRTTGITNTPSITIWVMCSSTLRRTRKKARFWS